VFLGLYVLEIESNIVAHFKELERARFPPDRRTLIFIAYRLLLSFIFHTDSITKKKLPSIFFRVPSWTGIRT
jgi:hypothetical protein